MATDNHLHLHLQWQSCQSTVLNNQPGHVEVYLNVVVPTLSASSSSSFTTTASPSHNLAFIVPVLLTFVQIKFPGINMWSSLFETHHTTTMAAIASLLLYWLALEAMQRFPAYTVNFRVVRTFSGLISIASLLALLLPDCWEHVPYYVLFMSYWVSRGFGFLRMMYGRVYRRVVEELLQNIWLIHYCQRVRRTSGLSPSTVMDTHDRTSICGLLPLTVMHMHDRMSYYA